MGWTFTTRTKGVPLTEYFIDHGVLSWSAESENTYRVLASSTIKLTEYYAAVEKINKLSGERTVWCAVFMCQFVRGRHQNFGYKDMDETVGPCIDNCPEHILDLLTPTDQEWANEWRQRCRAKIAAHKARPKVVVGTIFKGFDRKFEVVEHMGRRGYGVREINTGKPYRMSINVARKYSIEVPA